MVALATNDYGQLGVIWGLSGGEFVESLLDSWEFFPDHDLELTFGYTISVHKHSARQRLVLSIECFETFYHHVGKIGDHLNANGQ